MFMWKYIFDDVVTGVRTKIINETGNDCLITIDFNKDHLDVLIFWYHTRWDHQFYSQ